MIVESLFYDALQHMVGYMYSVFQKVAPKLLGIGLFSLRLA